MHDPETLRYFIDEVDRPSGAPSLLQMIKEGVEVPESTTLSATLKAEVASILAQGPPELTEEEHRTRRYYITDLIDDLRDPRTVHESIATGVRLYEVLADYYLRANGYWSGKAKWVPRALEAAADPGFCRRFNESFQTMFQGSCAKDVIELAGEILGPYGGFLFDGYRLDAPPDWRKT